MKETGEHLKETGKHLKETGERLKETGERLKETGEHLKETGEHWKETGEHLPYAVSCMQSVMRFCTGTSDRDPPLDVDRLEADPVVSTDVTPLKRVNFIPSNCCHPFETGKLHFK